LIIEDNEDIRQYIASILSPKYKILTAKDGLEGLDIARNKIPDIIVSDLMMPKLDGLSLSKKLKTDERTSHIPIIILTAKADMNSKIEGLESGADDYLIKPFNEKELKVRIDNLINQRIKLSQHYGQTLSLEPSNIQLTPPDVAFLKKIVDIMEENMSNFKFSVQAFQKEIGMSRMQLHRKIRALTGCSTSEFIRTHRLKRAAQILQTKGISVSEAAYCTGFNSLPYFAKCFKEQFGVTPSQYSKP